MPLHPESTPVLYGLQAVPGVGLAVIDTDTRTIEWANELFEQVMPDSPDVAVTLWASAFASENGSHVQKVDGSKYVEVTTATEIPPGGFPGFPKPSMLTISVRDVTELMNTRERIDLVLNTTYDGYFDWKIAEDYEYMSPRFWEMFGYDPSTKEHHPSAWMEIINKEDMKTALENFDLHIKSKGQHRYHQFVRYTHKDGHTVHVLCRGKVVEWAEDGSALRMIGTHTDMTESVNAANDARKSRALKKKVEAHAREKSRLINYIFHELRNPLHVISLGIATLMHEKGIDHDFIHSNIAYENSDLETQTLLLMKSALDRSRQIVDDTHCFERLESGLFDFNLIPCSAVKLVKDSCKYSSSEASQAKKNVRLDSSVDIADEFYCCVDILRSMQVLECLISNAIKFAAENVDIAISQDEEKNMVLISIEDDGEGIEAYNLASIFDPYSSIETTHTQVTKSYGLSLAMSERLVRGLGGEITIETRRRQGSKFTVALPGCEKPSEIVAPKHVTVSVPTLASTTVKLAPRKAKASKKSQHASNSTGSESESDVGVNIASADEQSQGSELINDDVTQQNNSSIPSSVNNSTGAKDNDTTLDSHNKETNGVAEEQALAGLKIVIVDDDAMNRKILTRLFRRLGAICSSVLEDGVQFVEFARSLDPASAPDVVLLDESMPRMKGSEALQQIRRESLLKSVPVVMLTGCVTDEDIRLYQEVGADDIICKPLGISKFYGVMKNLKLPKVSGVVAGKIGQIVV